MKNKIQLLLLFCAVAATAYSQKPQPALLNLGDPAPPLRVGEWIKGAPVKNFEDGKVYIVDFWATWCGGCMAAFPRLSVLARKYKRKVTVIAIDVYEKKGAVAKVKALVDSMGNRMDFDVATEDTNYTVHDWIEAWGQQDEGIPCTFVVDAQKKVAWIGEPWDLHAVLPKIFNNTWNVKNAKEAAISKRKTDNYLDSLDNEAGEKLGKYEGNYYTKDDLGQPDSTLLAISKIVSNEPRLKYVQMVASFTFTALLKKNPNEAIRYGEQALKESNYTGQPPYLGIIGGIKDYEYKLTLPAGVYQLGAEYYSQQIKQCPYPELFDNPKVYNTIANWYWSAGDKAKAMKARRKAKKLEKSIIAKSKTLNLKNEMYKY